MVGFWAVKPHAKDLKKFEDLIPLPMDKIRGKHKKIDRALIRPMTEEEKLEFKQLMNG